MKIFITETQLKNLRKFLTEISVQDAYGQFYKDIPQEEFTEIVNADPFSKSNFLSPYAKWLLGLYKNKNLKLEDLYKATKYIEVFNKVKSRLPIDKRDINKYKSLPDIFVSIQPYLESDEEVQSNTSLEKEIKRKETKRLFEDEYWLVIQPLTERAACYYGKNTEWCTAAKENNYFNYYNKQGPLFINIDKKNNRKYQFHFETSQFMDENDREIDLLDLIKRNPTLRNFYNNFLKDEVKNLNFNDLIINDDGCYIHVKDWSEFHGAFNTGQRSLNPAQMLNTLEERDFYYDITDETMRYYFSYINQSNLQFMIDYLIKDDRIGEDASDEEIEEAIIDDDELSTNINIALRWAMERAEKDAIYDDIIGELRKHFNIRSIEHTNRGIYLKMVTCPEPIILFGTSPDFIDKYSEIVGEIDFDYDNYYDREPDMKVFNEYLSDNIANL